MTHLPVCRSLIIKVASRCNLNCSYCYVYNQGDTTYRKQPKVMHSDTVKAIIARVRAHCHRHSISHFEFIFHGGEPLLVDRTFYVDFLRQAKKALPGITLSFTVQTNGTLLDDAWCRLLKALNIYIGISLDGPEDVNDLMRVDHQGRGSYKSVVKGIRNAQKFRLPFGILSVIDIHSDPLVVYEHLKLLSVRQINFLLPYGSYDHPPPGIAQASLTTPYADWLLTIFDQWWEDGQPKLRIRLFEQIIQLLLGIGGGYEAFGSRKLELLVIETDGSIEAAGSLKVCGHGFTKANRNVHQHDLDDALATDLARQYHTSHQQLPKLCTTCSLRTICGGGHMVHRHSASNGFDNPSVLCQDMIKLINHIERRLQEILPEKKEHLLSS